VGLRLPERGRLGLSRRQPGCRLGTLGECLVPTPFEFACYQAVVRIHAVIVPLRPLGLVACFLDGQGQRLAGEIMFRAHPLQGLHGRCDARRLDGFQDGGCHRAVDAEATDRQTGGGATRHAPPQGRYSVALGPWCHYRPQRASVRSVHSVASH